MSAIGIINTSVGSGNVGDHIIMDACMGHFMELLPNIQMLHFSSHDAFLYNALKLQGHVGVNLLCGTNCLSSHMAYMPGWPINPVSALLVKPVISVGVGWKSYQGKPDFYTKRILNKALNREGFLSVRDNYTKSKLEECGLKNVLNTGCPTLWSITKSHCSQIPSNKAANVVYTFTDYAPDIKADMYTLELLAKTYESRFIWIQGSKDLSYLASLTEQFPAFFKASKFMLIPPSLHAYDKFLANTDVDYIGTRLHGGIRAIQHKKRTIIIGVDNRAEEMGKDFDLPVLKRERIEELPLMIRAEHEVNIKLPVKEIDIFKDYLSTLNKKNAIGDFQYCI